MSAPKPKSKADQSWADSFESETSADNTPREVKIKDRAGNPYRDADGNPAVILVLGEYSDAVKEHDRRRTDQALRSAGQSIDADELDRRTAMRLASATAGWTLAMGGEAVLHSFQNAVTLYLRAPWIANDVARGMTAHVDFFEEKSRG